MGSDDAAGAVPDDAPPSSVAHEASLLLDLLSARGWSADPEAGPRRRPRDGAAGGAAAGVADGAPDPARDGGAGAAHAGARDGAGSPDRECTCGGTTPASCRVCPVCQLIAFVQKVDPDTIERVADVVGFAATALRDLATAQRDRRERPAHPGQTDHHHRTDGPTGRDDAPGGSA
ncbi:hypothetical protein [Terrabacter sp. NPDC000476]|uniref:hypothetical protein n=1 Tax=Terrabacter sp. NPDC000476 TaxID=3154258 RepID=UPI00332C95D0